MFQLLNLQPDGHVDPNTMSAELIRRDKSANRVILKGWHDHQHRLTKRNTAIHPAAQIGRVPRPEQRLKPGRPHRYIDKACLVLHPHLSKKARGVGHISLLDLV